MLTFLMMCCSVFKKRQHIAIQLSSTLEFVSTRKPNRSASLCFQPTQTDSPDCTTPMAMQRAISQPASPSVRIVQNIQCHRSATTVNVQLQAGAAHCTSRGKRSQSDLFRMYALPKEQVKFETQDTVICERLSLSPESTTFQLKTHNKKKR